MLFFSERECVRSPKLMRVADVLKGAIVIGSILLAQINFDMGRLLAQESPVEQPQAPSSDPVQDPIPNATPLGNPIGTTITPTPPAGAVSLIQNSRYELKWKWREPIILAAAAALLGVSRIPKVSPSCPCVAAAVNSFDRRYAGRKSDTADTASTVLLYTTSISPFVLEAFQGRKAIPEEVVLAETFLINEGLTALAKSLAARPRPFIYGVTSGSALSQRDTYTSFYSGHTSTSFAMTFAFAKTYIARKNYKHPILAYGIALALGGATGILRVSAGKHFPTDVMMGAATGTSLGVTLPNLHQVTTSVPH